MNRFIRILLEICGGILILAGLGLGAFIWRLEHGHIKAATIIPDIEAALNDMAPGLKFTIENAELRAHKRYRSITVNLSGIRVVNTEGERVGRLKEVNLGFSWRNIGSLSWAPVSMEVIAPRVEITRFPNGYVGFNLEEMDEERHPVSLATASDFLKHFPPNLRHIVVQDAFIRYDNQQDDYTFDIHDGLFDFHRRRRGIAGVMNVNFKSHEFSQRIQGTIATIDDPKVARITVGLKNFLLDQARLFSSDIPPEIQVNVPVDLLLTADIDETLQLSKIALQATGNKGDIIYPPYLPERLALKNLFLSSYYLPLEKKFELETLTLDSDKAHLSLKGSVHKIITEAGLEKADTQVNLLGLVERVPLDQLKHYWPHGLADDAREWVTVQLSEGIANRAAIELGMTLHADDTTTLNTMKGKIDFENVSVDYLPPMPMVKNVNGVAHFDQDNFTIETKGGKLFETISPQSRIHISNLTDDTRIALDIDMEGPIRDALTTIASKPLEYTQKMGLSADQFSGTAKTKLLLDFPINSELNLKQVAMKATAQLENVTARNIVKNLAVTASQLGLEVDTEKLSLQGNASLAGSPAYITWQEFFDEETEEKTVLSMKGRVTPALLAALDVPVKDYFSGTAEAQANIQQNREGSTQITANANLLNAGISVRELGLRKSRGSQGKLSMTTTMTSDGTMTLADVDASWPGFSVSQGMARLGSNGSLESLTLKNIRSGRTNASVIMTPQGANQSRIVVNGDVIDVSQIRDNYQAGPVAKNPKRLNISLRAGQLFINPKMPLRNVKADMLLQGSDVVTADISGKAGKTGSLVLQQTRKNDRSRALYVRAENAGLMLHVLDLSDNMYGGILLVNGQSLPSAPRVIKGNFAMDEFNVRDAPAMARLLNALSPGGLLNLFNQKGLGFKRMQANFSMADTNHITLSKGKMKGASLGLSFRGNLDREANTIDMRGTIVPIEGINKFASKIPVLGTVLTGLRGEGIFGATYRITGLADDPNVSVNPLSALAPGIFRSILFESND